MTLSGTWRTLGSTWRTRGEAAGFKQVWSTWKVWYPAFQNPAWPQASSGVKVEVHATTSETFYSLCAVSPWLNFFFFTTFPCSVYSSYIGLLMSTGSFLLLPNPNGCTLTFVKSLLKSPLVYEAWPEDQNSLPSLPYPALHSPTPLWSTHCLLMYTLLLCILGFCICGFNQLQTENTWGEKNKASLEKGNLNLPVTAYTEYLQQFT